MRIKSKINIAVCIIVMICVISVGINVISKIYENNKMIATLRDDIKIKSDNVQKLAENIKSLQKELSKTNEKLGSVEKEIKDIKN